MLRAVMDTNVLDSAFRSRLGKSFEGFVALRQDRWRAVLSNHLLHEYEEILKAHSAELGLSLADVDALLDAICAHAAPPSPSAPPRGLAESGRHPRPRPGKGTGDRGSNVHRPRGTTGGVIPSFTNNVTDGGEHGMKEEWQV